jgi:hypothetical protein
MARKPHLAALSVEELEDYRRRLRLEQAAVLSELALRAQVVNIENDSWSRKWDFYDYPEPPNDPS